jgi:uncharacterized protein
MKSLFHIAPLVMYLCLPANEIMAQVRPARSAAYLRLIARPRRDKGSIYLRWAVTDLKAWKLANQYGFTLVRYTVLRNKVMLDTVETKILTRQPLRPQPLNAWQELAKADNYAAVIAQALYGATFQVGGSQEGGVAQIVAQSQEQEQRYAFSLYAADMSFEAARMAGWGYVDSDVQSNEKYLYRLRTAIPARLLPSDSTGVFTGMADYQILPTVEEIQTQFGNQTALLTWDHIRLSAYFSAYFVERSLDNGQTFTRRNKIPITNMSEKDGKPLRRITYLDSLPDNTRNCQYRVRGINPFGEEGPPSQAKGGKGRLLLAFVPNIRQSVINPAGAVELTWEFEPQANEQIKGFELNKAPKADGPYQAVVRNIPPGQRSLTFDKLDASNYFTLTALAKEGESRVSFPVLVQPLDSLPPAVPSGLQALIDSTGNVRLTWKPNIEKDLLGYKIFRSFRKEEEIVPLTDSVWTGKTFTDKLSLRSLNKKVYYAIAAVDKRYNQSAASAVIEVKKPDRIPPSAAVFTHFEVEGNQAKLQWVNSPDEDVVAHLLYRRAFSDFKWVKIQEYRDRSVSAFTDPNLKNSDEYTYRLETVAENGLKTLSEEITLRTSALAEGKLTLLRLYATPLPDRKSMEIIWDDRIPQVKEYHVYKAENDNPLTLWQVVKGSEKGIFDNQIQPNTRYQYAVMAVTFQGTYSETKTVKVRY